MSTLLQERSPHRTHDPERSAPPRTDDDDRASYVSWILFLLVLAAVPRLMMAARSLPICDDGYFYLAVGDALKSGAYESALSYLNINVYPVILVGLSSLGLPMLPMAQLWGVLVGTLVVLPLFGWIRRTLNARIAFCSCLVYAVHPEFIEYCTEPIRDATFWFLSALSFYCCWRAAREQKYYLFAAAGISVALAAHTRSEGWLLVLPMLAWPLIRLRHVARAERKRILAGLALSCAMTPLFILAYNLAVLQNHSRWELGKLAHFQMAVTWIQEVGKPGTSPAEKDSEAAPLDPTLGIQEMIDRLNDSTPGRVPRTLQEKISDFGDGLTNSLKPITLLLMLAGAIAGRRLLIRREHLILSAIVLALFLGVWIRLATLGEINGRYFLAAFFPAAGSVGLGLRAVLLWVEARFQRMKSIQRPRVAVASILGIIGLLHVGSALVIEHPARLREAKIGEAIGQQVGSNKKILVIPHASRIAFYAGGEMPQLVLRTAPLVTLAEESQAEVAILEHEYTHDLSCAMMATELLENGWEHHRLQGIPDTEHLLIFTKRPNPAKIATSMGSSQEKSR